MAEKETKIVEAENKPQKAKKVKKNSKVKDAWRGFKSEFKKITWPSWLQVRKNTLVVIVVVVLATILIGALDYAFKEGFIALTNLFS